MKNRLIALCAALCLVLPLGTGALAAQSTDTALETVKVLEAQLMMRHYKGFLE